MYMIYIYIPGSPNDPDPLVLIDRFPSLSWEGSTTKIEDIHRLYIIIIIIYIYACIYIYTCINQDVVFFISQDFDLRCARRSPGCVPEGGSPGVRRVLTSPVPAGVRHGEKRWMEATDSYTGGPKKTCPGWWFQICCCTSSARTSRGRKFPKGKELYSKERICL